MHPHVTTAAKVPPRITKSSHRDSLFSLALACTLLAAALPARAARRCDSPATAARRMNQKICVQAHVYQEINLDDGTRILDICAPEVNSSDCRFAFVSLDRNRSAVGSLKPYIGKEVEIFGEIRPINGRSEILLRSAKQIQVHTRYQNARAQQVSQHRSRFHPNPELLKGFNAIESRMPIIDPAFRTSSRN